MNSYSSFRFCFFIDIIRYDIYFTGKKYKISLTPSVTYLFFSPIFCLFKIKIKLVTIYIYFWIDNWLEENISLSHI